MTGELEAIRESDNDSNNVNEPHTVPRDSDSFRRHKVSLPTLELPSFDGSPEKFHRFISSFESVISKYNLSSFEKFSDSKKQLSGSAKTLLESIALEQRFSTGVPRH